MDLFVPTSALLTSARTRDWTIAYRVEEVTSSIADIVQVLVA